MSTNLEIEYKSLLSLAEYDQLKKLFTHVTPVRQTNHYLDSKDFKLRKKNWLCVLELLISPQK